MSDLGISWKVTTQPAPTQSADSTSSSLPTGSTGSTGSAAAGGVEYVDPRVALERSSFQQKEPVTAAQHGHRLLSTQPPVPTDGAPITNKTAILANATREKMHSLGHGFGSGAGAGFATSLAANPERQGVERDSTDINPYSESSGSSPFSVTDSSGDSLSTPTDTTPVTTDTTTTTTSTTDSTDSKAQDAADKLVDDANADNGGCKRASGDSKHDAADMEMHMAGLNGDEFNYVKDKIKNDKDGSGQLMADAVIAMQQNPQEKDQIMAAIKTLAKNEKAAVSSGATGATATQAYNQAAQQLTALVKQAGFTNLGNGADGIVIGASQPPPPTPGKDGWTIWAPETQV